MTEYLMECQHCGQTSGQGSFSALYGLCCDNCRREFEREDRVQQHHELAAAIADELAKVFKA